jgi:hypothetical protein
VRRPKFTINLSSTENTALLLQSTAIAYERGKVLRTLLMALDHLISFARSNEVGEELDFASVFIRLISSRPSVCAEALDRFADLRTLGVRTVYQEFEKCVKGSNGTDTGKGVKILLYPPREEKESILTLPLLQAASVLLSIWTDREDDSKALQHENGAEVSGESNATSCITNLANMLLHPITSEENHGELKVAERGLASAVMAETGNSAVSVESVSYRQMHHGSMVNHCLAL